MEDEEIIRRWLDIPKETWIKIRDELRWVPQVEHLMKLAREDEREKILKTLKKEEILKKFTRGDGR